MDQASDEGDRRRILGKFRSWPRVVLLSGFLAVLGLGVWLAADASTPLIFTRSEAQLFSPDGDGQEDTVWLQYCLTAPANVDITVVDADERVVRTIETGVSHHGDLWCVNSGSNNGVEWNGKSDSGGIVPDGMYVVRFRAVDSAGDVGAGAVQLGVDTRLPGRLTSPSPGDTVSGPVSWTFTPTNGFAVDTAWVTCDRGLVSSTGDASNGTFTGTIDSTMCDDGQNGFRATVGWTDAFGRVHYWGAPLLPVVVENPPSVRISYSDRYFSPNGDDQEDVYALSYCLTSAANVDVTVLDTGGAVVRALEAGIARSGGIGCVSSSGTWHHAQWDGKNDSGAVVPDGVYTVRVRATNTRGQSADATSRAGVDARSRGVLAAPAAGATISGETSWSFTPAAGGLDYVSLYCGNYSFYLGSSGSPAEDGTFGGVFDAASCNAGGNDLRAVTWWRDDFGASHSWSAPPIAVTVAVPPRVNVASGSDRYFSPNGDLQEDLFYIRYCLTAPATVDITVVDSTGAVVRTLESGVARDGQLNCPFWNNFAEWDGKSDAGTAVEDGEYTIRVHAVDSGGRAGDGTLRTGVATALPGALTAPAANATVSGAAEWVFAPASGFPVNQVWTSCDSGVLYSSSLAPRADGMFSAEFDSTACDSGTNGLRATAYWADPMGAHHAWTTPSTPINVENAPRVTLHPFWAQRYFSPNGDGQEDVTWVYYCLSAPGTVNVTVVDSSGSVIRTIESGVQRDGRASCYYYDHAAEWDGKTDNGTVAADGEYSLRISMTGAAGRTAEAAARLGIDTRVPGQLVSPASGSTLAGLASLVFQPANGFTPSRVDICFSGDDCAPVYGAAPDGTWRTSIFAGTLTSGPSTVLTVVEWTDPFGQLHWWNAPQTPVVIDNASLPLTVTATPLTGAAPLDITLAVTTSDPQARTVRYTVNFGDGTANSSGDVANPYPVVSLPHRYTNPGVYRAVVTATNSAGASAATSVDITVTGSANTAPVPSLAVSSPTGVAPHPVRVAISATDAENDNLSYRLDYGDETSVVDGSLPIGDSDHTYQRSGTYVVRLAVSDGKLTTTRTASVVVALAEPLSANAGDDQSAVVNSVVHLDGSGSRPSLGIESFRWDFGDGTSASTQVADHTYAAAGTYTAVLTVTAAGQTRTDAAVVTVTPVPAEPGLVVTVDNGSAPLAGATVVVVDPTGRRYTAQTDTSGRGRVTGLPDGDYTVYGWQSGYLPATATSTVAGGSAAAVLHLKAGEVATTELTSEPLTYEEIVAAGIDPDDPANQNVYEFTVNLAIATSSVTVSGYTGSSGSSGSGGFPLCPKVDGATIPCSGSAVITVDDYQVTVHPTYVNNTPQLVWLVMPVKASWLKEFFSVQLGVTNLADPGFTLAHGAATLDLPTGLTLAPTPTPQQRTISMADVAGGQTSTASWLVRGDTEGFYDLTATYGAVLEPLGATLRVDARTAKPLHVWGGSAVQITVDTESDLWDRYPFHVRVGLKNVADVPIYNAAVELPSQAGAHYLHQPRQALRQSTAVIAPGATFWTDDYILAPDISGRVDLARSFITMLSGANPPQATITTHTPLASPDTTPVLQAFRLIHGVGLIWAPVPGATSYEVYSTPDRATEFGATPLTTVAGSATQAVLPDFADTSSWFAVSALVNGRHVMVHPLTQAFTGDAGPQAWIQLSSQASCNTDVSATVKFDNLFADLAKYSATLSSDALGTKEIVRDTPLSGRNTTVTLPVLRAGDIALDGSKLLVTVTDTAGATGQHTVQVSRKCNPIKMLVLGDSISWGQGLKEEHKYATLVRDAIQTKTGKAVTVEMLAHSGAHLQPRGCDPDHGLDGGEVPSATPDIGTCQLAAAKGKDADLILVDGCINDVDAVMIPFRPAWDTKSKVDQLCTTNMQKLLKQLNIDHPRATIVLTGYYPIVTGGSQVTATVVAGMFNLSAAAAASVTTAAMVVNSYEFYDNSNAALNQAMAAAGGGTIPSWLRFADPRLNGYTDGVLSAGAKLWPPGADEVAGSRAWDCLRTLQINTCFIASVAHPNVAGAKNYFDAVMAQLTGDLERWKGPGNVTSLKIGLPSPAMAKGDTQTVSVTATYQNGETRDAASLVDVTSANQSIVTVDQATMTMKAVGAGTTSITATMKNGSAPTATASVTVGPAVPRSLAITPAAPLVAAGKKVTLTATATMSDGSTTIVTPRTTWTSSNSTIATVNTKAVVVGVTAGTATLTGTYRTTAGTTLTATSTVTVLGGPPQITGFTPVGGPPGTVVTIEGANLLGVTSVTFGGVVASTYTINSSSSITVTVPSGAKTGAIAIESPLGSARSKAKFAVRR